MPSFKIGDKVKIKYWDELPDRPGWSEDFFKMYSGRKVKILAMTGESAFDVYVEDSGDYLTVGFHSLKKDFHVPDELFEM